MESDKLYRVKKEEGKLNFPIMSDLRTFITGDDKIKEVLSGREQDIIRKRYGIGGFKIKTQREIAAEYGISRSYISRIEKSALLKLRKSYENDCL